jgi:hypothetical protein
MQSEEPSSGGGEPPKSNGAYRMPKWVVLLPVSVDLASVMREPVEPQLTLHAVIAKAVSVVGRLRQRLSVVGHLGTAGSPRDNSDDGN